MHGENNIRRYLSQHHIIEGNDETQRRTRALWQLRELIPEFIARLVRNNSVKRDNFECQLLPFGSYGLGSYIKGADIDVVFLGAAPVRRKHFFSIFPKLLEELPNSSKPECIRRTHVPIIKFTLDGFSVDISFVSLPINTVPPRINLLDDRLLHRLDEVCLASMDGPRTERFIKDRIRVQHISVFQTVLQVIKHWANQRCLYGKQIGFLNGSTWTFLLVKTYMLADPNSVSVENLLFMFFETWARWDWPKPVMLTKAIPGEGNKQLEYEDLTEFHDAVMPIVSPCYPVCSAAPYVTKSTRQIITEELERAYAIVQSHYSRNGGNTDIMLDQLFHRVGFFKRYHHFLQVSVTAETVKSKDTWIRKMAFALRQLVESLENNPCLVRIHPYTKVYEHHFQYRTMQGRMALEDGHLERENDYAGALEPGMLHVVCYLVGLKPQLPQGGYPVIDISEQVDQFRKRLEEKRNEKDADVTFAIKAIKRVEVPDWIRIYNQ